MTKKEIVELWHETQVGHYKRCREKQIEFSEVMWKLCEGMNEDEHKDT
jgi:hypothetical protein